MMPSNSTYKVTFLLMSVVESNPEDENTLRVIIETYEEMGEHKKAEEAFKKSFNILM